MNEEFEGYACLFDQIDLGNDVVVRGAFERSLAEKLPHKISMLWQHDPSQPIGVWQTIQTDEKGLYVTGRLSTDISQAHDIAVMLDDRVIDGLSIGFKTRRAVQKARQSARYIHDIDLWEISIVTFPMQLGARILNAEMGLSQRISRATNSIRA